jgi:dienelactone hydrolase
VAEANLRLRRVLPEANRRVTFMSDLDGSVQFYGHLPAARDQRPKALVLSLHGAGVDALNQSGSYAAKPWAHIVAPTNRRPFGFNWEGWGRHDALEVLLRGIRELDVDPHRVYLTGHSMGGHGAWHLATLYPDLFATVGPSAGWVSFWSYRPSRPVEPSSPVEELVQRATLSSHTLEFAPNLEPLGVYVLHGDGDDNVPVDQARLMVDRLAGFHRDDLVHEQPGAGHWWDLDEEEPGVDCVDWAPMFDFFIRHRRPSLDEVRRVRFSVADPAVSAWNAWVCLARPREPFVIASVDAFLQPGRHRITATTDNVETVGFDVESLGTETVTAVLDGSEVSAAVPEDGVVWFRRDAGGEWQATPESPRTEKGPHRYGSFRDVLRNRVQFVVATGGTPEENALAYASARQDAEYLWYQGNGSVPVLPDTLFDPAGEPDRNVVLYGNADTHRHWTTLVDGEVEVRRDRARVGDRVFEASGIGVLAVRPRPDSETGSVGIVAATGAAGTRLLWGRPYLAPGFSFPDLTLFEDVGGGKVVRFAGFFANDWSVAAGTFASID